MNYSRQQNQTYFIKTQTGLKQLSIPDIVYVRANGYVSVFHLSDDVDRPSVSKLLKEVEVELTSFGFLRISRDTLLNMQFVQLLWKNRVTLTNGDELTVSARKQKIVRDFLLQVSNRGLPPLP